MKNLAILAALLPGAAVAQAPIASSSFSGAEDPLFENGAWKCIQAQIQTVARKYFADDNYARVRFLPPASR